MRDAAARLKGWLVRHTLGWTVSAAATLTALRFITPSFVDMLIDFLVLGLVWVAGAMARQTAK